jgi:hypothetical protein
VRFAGAHLLQLLLAQPTPLEQRIPALGLGDACEGLVLAGEGGEVLRLVLRPAHGLVGGDVCSFVGEDRGEHTPDGSAARWSRRGGLRIGVAGGVNVNRLDSRPLVAAT